jgi:hypothetical protein
MPAELALAQAATARMAHQCYLKQVAAGARIGVCLQLLVPLHVLNLHLIIRHGCCSWTVAAASAAALMLPPLLLLLGVL